MVLDRVVSLFAPFTCLLCGERGSVLCEACRDTALPKLPSRCYRCHRTTLQFQVCSACRKAAAMQHLWAVTPYEGLGKQMIDMLKFERAAGVARDIGVCISSSLPLLPEDTLVCYIPTTSHRRRVRGYDQAKLMAKEIARLHSLQLSPLLVRTKDTRQVGSDRKTRRIQAEMSYELNGKFDVAGKNILIVDDVTTSGATLEAAAHLFKAAGAKPIDAVVFAQAMDA